MTIRTILVPLSGGAASEGAADTACRLALQFAAHLEALHVRPDPAETVALLGADSMMPVTTEMMDLAAREGERAEKKAQAIFEAAVARHAIAMREAPGEPGAATAAGASAFWRDEMGHAAEIVARRARVFDLVVLGQSGRVTDKAYSDTLEAAVRGGGRPVLLAPMRPGELLGKVIAIAWNGSVEAARAVAAAMPFLANARDIHVLTAKDADEPPGAADLSNYLAWHGLRAATHLVHPVDGVGTGALVLSAARDLGADLLVMGGYGRAPWWQMIFGGTTREVVGVSRLPLLLAH
jgi:nucleotide-binding universal stress UspA family protein